MSIAYSYDQGSNGIGRLTGVSDATGSTVYTYDQKGRLIHDSRVIGGLTYVTSYSYDSAGRLIGLTYPGGRQVNYALDALGRIAQITTSVNGKVRRCCPRPPIVLSAACSRSPTATLNPTFAPMISTNGSAVTRSATRV